MIYSPSENKTEQKRKLLNLLTLEARLRMPDKMKALFTPKRYKFAWGGRGGSKSMSFAKYCLFKANTEKHRIVCGREIQNSIKDSVYTLLKDQIETLRYSDFIPTQNTIRNLRTGSEFIFIGFYGQEKTQNIKSLEGATIAWIEEAQILSKGSLDLLDPTIRKKGSELLFSFNRILPDDPIWLFKERIESESKIEININYDENPYLPDELRMLAERSKREYDNRISEDYLYIWKGEPIGLSDRNIIKLRDVESAINRIVMSEGQEQIGVDVARFGKDKTVMYKRKGMRIIDNQVYTETSIVETANLIKSFINYDKSIPIKVDDTGVGGGVTDILKSEGYNAIPINFGQEANDPDKYPNAISEMWFYLKSIMSEIQLINDPELKSELITREWKTDNKGRRCVESKEDYKKRFYKSPDKADALLLTYYQMDNRPSMNLGPIEFKERFTV